MSLCASGNFWIAEQFNHIWKIKREIKDSKFKQDLWKLSFSLERPC